jgi:putative flippase GtrA
MITYIKAQAALIAGSLADFLVTIILKEVFHCWYVEANMAGNIVGAIAQFILCRNWAFNAGNQKVNFQIFKFIIVWIGNIILSAAGVYLLTNYLAINYIISKTIVSALLGLTYNYFLQKKYVFA